MHEGGFPIMAILGSPFQWLRPPGDWRYAAILWLPGCFGPVRKLPLLVAGALGPARRVFKAIW
jgi:hypothetical protein